MINQEFSQYLAKVNANFESLAASEGWTYIPETVEEWAKRGVHSEAERDAWWDEVEAQEEAKEQRKGYYA